MKIKILTNRAAALVAMSFGIAALSISSCSRTENQEIDGTKDSASAWNAEKLAALFENDEWTAPDTSLLPHDKSGELIRYGRTLISTTGEYFGPGGKISHEANGMNCQNCHLNAGTKLYANSYSAVFSIYPKWRPRSGTVEDLQRRINDCMERSMNGKALDPQSREMKAMVAYINWVGKDVKKGVTPKGAAAVTLPYLDRAADPERGKLVFEKNCVSCHGSDGHGKLNADSNTFMYPPLWGPRSYNTAAGLFRLSRFAGYVKSNMPYLLSSYEKPVLTDEEAWDIAAYVNSMPRPEKKFKNDWPDISKKPVDHPFGPYADNFSEHRHKYGPFKEIADLNKKNK